MRHKLEYLPVRLLGKFLGALPRSWARAFGITLGMLAYTGQRSTFDLDELLKGV